MKQLQVILINPSTCFRELKFQHRAGGKSVPWDGIQLPSKLSRNPLLIKNTRHKNCSSISLEQHSIHHLNSLKKDSLPFLLFPTTDLTRVVFFTSISPMPVSLEKLLLPVLTVPGKKKIKFQLSSTAGTRATFSGLL